LSVFAGFFPGSIRPGAGDPVKETVMAALLPQEFGPMPAAPEPGKIDSMSEAGTARSATIFAAIYLALVLGSPLIVRYGPSTDDHTMAALATRMEKPRCATAPEFGYPCPGRTLMARDADTSRKPDL
jgi:hypothetical protein